MLRYEAQNEKFTGWKGIAVIAAIIAAVYADSLLCQIIAGVVSPFVGTVAFWLIGAVIALTTMRVFILGYSYTLTSSALKVAHLYAKYERPKDTIYTSTIVSAGTEAEVMRYHPGANVCKCVLRRCPVEPFAIGFTRDDEDCVFVFQTDEKMKARLREIAKENRK